MSDNDELVARKMIDDAMITFISNDTHTHTRAIMLLSNVTIMLVQFRGFSSDLLVL